MAGSASRERTRAILQEIVNAACANEIAGTHPESEPGTSEDEDVAVENEHMQGIMEEIAASNEDEQEQLTSRKRKILREIVNACANEIAATHPEPEPSTDDETSEDATAAAELQQDFNGEESARDGDEQRTSRKRKIEEAITNLQSTYVKMETRKLKFRRIEEDLANARHHERMEIQQNMCKLIADTLSDAVTRCLEPRGA